jgi:hypothetical protein
MLVEAVSSIEKKSPKFHPKEACETILPALFDLYEDSFLFVTVDKGISNGMPKKNGQS